MSHQNTALVLSLLLHALVLSCALVFAGNVVQVQPPVRIASSPQLTKANTWYSGSAQTMVSGPPGRSTRTVRPVNLRRIAATAVAQAPVPHARVRPTPRSHTRKAR